MRLAKILTIVLTLSGCATSPYVNRVPLSTFQGVTQYGVVVGVRVSLP